MITFWGADQCVLMQLTTRLFSNKSMLLQLMPYLIFNISSTLQYNSSLIRSIATASATPPATVCLSCDPYSAMDSTYQLLPLKLIISPRLCHYLTCCMLTWPNGKHPVFLRLCGLNKCQEFTGKEDSRIKICAI